MMFGTVDSSLYREKDVVYFALRWEKPDKEIAELVLKAKGFGIDGEHINAIVNDARAGRIAEAFEAFAIAVFEKEFNEE